MLAPCKIFECDAPDPQIVPTGTALIGAPYLDQLKVALRTTRKVGTVKALLLCIQTRKKLIVVSPNQAAKT